MAVSLGIRGWYCHLHQSRWCRFNTIRLGAEYGLRWGQQRPRLCAPTVVDRYGAVAFDNTTNSYGYSFNVGSLSEAKSKAISDCNSKSCEIVSTYKNSCAAFAAGYKPDGGTYGSFKYDLNLNTTKVNAIKECSNKASNCQVLMAECSRI